MKLVPTLLSEICNVELSILLSDIEILGFVVFSNVVSLVESGNGVDMDITSMFVDEIEIRVNTELNCVSLLSSSVLPTGG